MTATKTTKKTARTNAPAAAKGDPKKKDAKKTDQHAASKKVAKAGVPAKPKRTSALDAAAIVLKKTGKPMRSQELITAMGEQKLWTSPGGKTPHATLYAAILREITEKKGEARFKKVDRGQFAFIG